METSNIGNIFSIKKFAIHDGKGIRTTIFLKGCNLRCRWCHNTEGLEVLPKYHILKRCIQCNECKLVDEENRISCDKKQYTITGNHDIKKYQDKCVMDAIQLDCKQVTIKELLNIIEEDKVFYRHGGGVTFSGGEPLLQYDYLLEALKHLKQQNIHCALESAFHYNYQKIEILLPYLDEIFVDFKLHDDALHTKYTSITNTQIQANIQKLLQSKHSHKVTIRTPLIPDYTATKQNIEDIARTLSTWNASVCYELLNYNPLALQKYNDLQLNFCFEENKPMYTPKEMEEFRTVARKYLKNVK